MRLAQKWLAVLLPFSLLLALLASCAAPAGPQAATDGIDLKARLVSANLLAGSLAEGLNSATRGQAIDPDSDQALLIVQTLDAVERSLDGAGTALRAGLPAMAERQIGAAESQLVGLQPLLPTDDRGETP
jgi:hypothetical protein